MKILAKKKKFVIFVFGLLLVIFLLNVFQKEVKGFFYWFSAPIQKVLWRVGDRVSDFFESFIRIKKLKSETDELKIKNQELLAKIVVFNELEKENRFLREALGIGLQKEFKLALAQIIGKDISQDFILIDKGSQDGLSKGLPVITQQKVLVGKISELYGKFSKVMLISNKKSSFDAKVQDEEKNISGIIKGEGNFKILFDLVPQEEEIYQKDIVVTSALGNIFPEALMIGRIKEIKKSDVEPFQQAEIEPFFDISQTEKIFIILEF